MDEGGEAGAGRIADLIDVLQAFRRVGPVISVGAAILFLKLVEGRGFASLEDVSKQAGIPFSQVCRFADNLSEGAARNVSGLGLAQRDPCSRPGLTRYALTDAGRELARTLGVDMASAG